MARRRRARLILPRARDGELARQLGSVVGDDAASLIRGASRDFYWPVPVGVTPKGVPMYAHQGEFLKPIMGGAGFASLSDLIAEATAGKQQQRPYMKIGALSVAGGAEVGKDIVGVPGAGFTPGGLGGGTVPTNASAGALGQDDAAGSDTLHLTTVVMTAQGNPALAILYDLLWCGALSTNSNATQAITGTPTRQNTTDGTCRGNFAFPAVRGPSTNLAATAHNHTVCQYKDQSDNTAESFASHTGVSACAFNRIDLVAPQWFMALNSGDEGIKALTQWQLSAAVGTGQIDVSLAHPIAYIPCPASGVPGVVDGVNSMFSLKQIENGACLNLLWIRPATGATSLNGLITMVSG